MALSERRIQVLEVDNEYAFNTYPDFVFLRENIPCFILDAKFIPAWDKVAYGRSENNTSGLLDDYTKCMRDMVSINAAFAGIIYPTKNQQKISKVKHRISNYNSTDSFFVFPVSVPIIDDASVSYEQWSEQYNQSVDYAMNLIIQELQKIK